MKNQLLILFLIGASFAAITSCESSDKKPSDSASLVQEQYRLKEDRESFDEIRKNVPEDKKIENDEMALILELMNDLSRSPSSIREKFDEMVRKKRNKVQKDLENRRAEYVKIEKSQREKFTKTAEKNRKSFASQKHSPEERNEFFGEQDNNRRIFYSEQRDKREEFEADMRDQRKNFDDYIRAKTLEFNQEHKAFIKKKSPIE